MSIINSVSVVIPVFNSGFSASLAIESVLNQVSLCKEIIIVDDGSTDNTFDYLKDKFKSYNNIYIYTKNNSGAAEARNYGIERCTGNWIAFLDSDDLWFPNKIFIQLEYISSDDDIALIGSNTTMSGNKFFFTSGKYIEVTLLMLLFKNYFQPSTVMIKKSILDKVGYFPPGRRYAEEGDLFMRIVKNYKSILINEVLVDYAAGKPGFGSSGLSSNLVEMEKGELVNIMSVLSRSDAPIFIVFLAIVASVLKFIRRFFVSKFKILFS